MILTIFMICVPYQHFVVVDVYGFQHCLEVNIGSMFNAIWMYGWKIITRGSCAVQTWQPSSFAWVLSVCYEKMWAKWGSLELLPCSILYHYFFPVYGHPSWLCTENTRDIKWSREEVPGAPIKRYSFWGYFWRWFWSLNATVSDN